MHQHKRRRLLIEPELEPLSRKKTTTLVESSQEGSPATKRGTFRETKAEEECVTSAEEREKEVLAAAEELSKILRSSSSSRETSSWLPPLCALLPSIAALTPSTQASCLQILSVWTLEESQLHAFVEAFLSSPLPIALQLCLLHCLLPKLKALLNQPASRLLFKTLEILHKAAPDLLMLLMARLAHTSALSPHHLELIQRVCKQMLSKSQLATFFTLLLDFTYGPDIPEDCATVAWNVEALLGNAQMGGVEVEKTLTLPLNARTIRALNNILLLVSDYYIIIVYL